MAEPAAERGQALETYRAYLGLLAGLQLPGWLRGKVAGSDIVQQTMLQAYGQRAQFPGQS